MPEPCSCVDACLSVVVCVMHSSLSSALCVIHDRSESARAHASPRMHTVMRGWCVYVAWVVCLCRFRLRVVVSLYLEYLCIRTLPLDCKSLIHLCGSVFESTAKKEEKKKAPPPAEEEDMGFSLFD